MLSRKELELVKSTLNNSKVIAFPTETVMGLGVFYDDYDAYQLLNKIKGRPENKPYTLMLGDIKDIEKFAYVSARDKKIIKAFMPGAVTLLLKARDVVPGYVTHNTGVIGVRVPDLKEIQELINYCEKPLLVPSANKSGDKHALTSEEVKEIFKDELGYIIEGEARGGVPSTIVDLTGEQVKIVREGPITLNQIKEALIWK